MNIFSNFKKPEYVFRPAQIWRRLVREFSRARDVEMVMLPWGLPIQIRPGETIGSCIWRLGIYDLCVSECIWRLLDEGETSLDIGANIGHMTALMAIRAGRVIALEPHPDIFRELTQNVSGWRGIEGLAKIDLLELAASENVGRALLHLPKCFDTNRGMASLENDAQEEFQACEVTLTTLDDVVPFGTEVGIIKIDVEGHELSVLNGGKRLFESGAVRDIVFEEHSTPPTQVTDRLELWGYEVFYLDAALSGPKIVPLTKIHTRNRVDAPNCIATLDSQRVRERMRRGGWQILGKRKTRVPA